MDCSIIIEYRTAYFVVDGYYEIVPVYECLTKPSVMPGSTQKQLVVSKRQQSFQTAKKGRATRSGSLDKWREAALEKLSQQQQQLLHCAPVSHLTLCHHCE